MQYVCMLNPALCLSVFFSLSLTLEHIYLRRGIDEGGERYTYIHARMYAFVYIDTHTCTCTRACTYAPTHTYAYTYTYIHVCVYKGTPAHRYKGR